MSIGPGRIGRAIIAAFAAEPDNAFVTEELITRAYAGLDKIEKKHRVAVLRAAKSLSVTIPCISWLRSGGPGRRLVFFDRYRVLSFAMARLKADGGYKPSDRQTTPGRSEDDLRAELRRGGRHHTYIVEGGAWWRYVQQSIAERDGDSQMGARMEAENIRQRMA